MTDDEIQQDENTIETEEVQEAAEEETETPAPPPQPDPLFREVWLNEVVNCDELLVGSTVWTMRSEFVLGDDGQWHEGEWLPYTAQEVLRPATMDECPTSVAEEPVEESWPEIGEPLVIEAEEPAEVEAAPVADVAVQAGPELLAETGAQTDGWTLLAVAGALLLGGVGGLVLRWIQEKR